MKQKAKEWIEKIAIPVIVAILVLILTALFKGEPLNGLLRMGHLFHFFTTGIPLWLFIVVLVIAIFGLMQWLRRRKKILYAVWESHQCLWGVGAIGDTPAMQLVIQGLFTNSDREKALIINQIYLKKTKPGTALLTPLEIPAHHSVKKTVHAFVQPVVEGKGRPYKGTIIFVDQFERKHKLPIEFRSMN